MLRHARRGRVKASVRARRRSSPEIQIAVGAGRDRAPLYSQLYRQLRSHIVSGILAPGARLPSARVLAVDLAVSRNTVEAALEQLVAEGFVTRRVGAGTTVAASLADIAPFANATKAKRDKRAERPTPIAAPFLSARGRAIATLGRIEIESDGDPGVCAPDINVFPERAWHRVMARLAREGGTSLLSSIHPEGLPQLRQQIAAYASLARGLRCSADQVLIVNSTQQAIDLTARVLLDPGDMACVEDPGYPSARAALVAAGLTISPVAVDAQGLDVRRLPSTPSRRLVYTTPSHQFPTGVTLSLRRRLQLLDWANRTGGWLLEDDYDSEFRYDGRPLAALHALDTHDRVVYVATCNKLLFPGLRLAYLILPPALVDAFAAARRLTDGHSSPLAQVTLAEFMATGQFAAHVRQARHLYATKRDLLIRTIAELWGSAVRLGPTSAGLHVVAYLPAGTDDGALARASEGQGMSVRALSTYAVGPARPPGLILSFGAASPGGIRASVAALARAIRRTRR
jgi:GntR family transcriptional regulator/MocR family aminotransferase